MEAFGENPYGLLLAVAFLLYAIIKEVIGPVVKSKAFAKGIDRRNENGGSENGNGENGNGRHVSHRELNRLLSQLDVRMNKLEDNQARVAAGVQEHSMISTRNGDILTRLEAALNHFKSVVYNKLDDVEKAAQVIDKRVLILEHDAKKTAAGGD